MTITKTQHRQLSLLQTKKILILGAGREGLSTYRFLRQQFPQKKLTLADQCLRSQLKSVWRRAFADDLYLSGQFGPATYLTNLKQFDLIFRTPGIPLTLPALVSALAQGVKFTSNTEWFLKLARGTTIGVTGTKGKSTTSSLIAHVLDAAGKSVQLLGNIGFPPLDFLEKTNPKTYTILEMSAHQLQDLHQSPHYAVVQNITSEHLDYYHRTADYVAAKSSIVRFQKSTDFLIYSDDFKTPRSFATLSRAHPLTFGYHDAPNHLAFVHGRAIFYHPPTQKYPESIVDLRRLKLLGKHNLYNVMPAIILAKNLGISNEQIATAIYSFTPLRHRLEYVCTVNDVSYYNDSLSTTPQAAVAALKVFADKDIILLAGGFERHQSFHDFANQILKNKVHAVILFPPTGARLKRTIIDLAIKKKLLVPKFFSADTMPAAVTLAASLAKPHDLVLLSPAAASFSNFRDYADRGDQFCQSAKNLLQ